MIPNLVRSQQEPYLAWQKGKKLEEPLNWGSYQPALIHMLHSINTGSVIEFGIGAYSTPLLNAICTRQKRQLLSLENNKRWFFRYIRYRNPYHSLFSFVDERIVSRQYNFFNKKFSIAFVDAHPGWLRQVFIDNMINNVDYFVVHDTEDWISKKENPYNWDFSKFKHIWHFKDTFPHTSILSNLDNIDYEQMNSLFIQHETI